MNFEISISSLIAAQEIMKDQNIIKKEKRLDTYYLSTLDYRDGNELIRHIGGEYFENLYRNRNDQHQKKRILRAILMHILKKNKPGYIFSIPKGRNHFCEQLSINFKQVFTEAALLKPIDHTDESKEIIKWWDDISEFVRSLMANKKLEKGREGEKKTYYYEIKKLNKLKINLKPNMDCIDDNLLGYDVQSWDADSKKIFIEAKYSSNSNGNFHFSRNAWLYAQSVKEKYLVHIWIQQTESPTIMKFHKLKDHVAKYEEISGEGDKWESLIITPKGRN